jgi:hypothetical protein
MYHNAGVFLMEFRVAEGRKEGRKEGREEGREGWWQEGEGREEGRTMKEKR